MWATSRSIARMRALRRHRVADGDRATVIACVDAIQLSLPMRLAFDSWLRGDDRTKSAGGSARSGGVLWSTG
jgi:hypothetical protein